MTNERHPQPAIKITTEGIRETSSRCSGARFGNANTDMTNQNNEATINTTPNHRRIFIQLFLGRKRYLRSAGRLRTLQATNKSPAKIKGQRIFVGIKKSSTMIATAKISAPSN